MTHAITPQKFDSLRQRVVALGFGGSRTPSTRYRMLQFLEPLRCKGLVIEFRSSQELDSWSSVSKYIEDGRGPEDSPPILWLQKKLFPVSWIWRLARKYPIVFDFDDAIWTSERVGRSVWTRWRASWKLRHVLKKSTLVIAGNRFLAAYAMKYASRVVVIPTVINVEDYPIKTHRTNSSITLGWIGQSVNHVYLEQLNEVLTKLRPLLEFKLLVVSDKPFAHPTVDVINRTWSLDTEITDILDMDIGLMPLDDTPWTRGKCAFKAIQYMAAGIPAVASRIGANIDLISDGDNGRLVDAPETWISAILDLANDPSLRQRIGLRARATVELRYSTKLAVHELATLLQNLERTAPREH